jgi:hypothetical protein
MPDEDSLRHKYTPLPEEPRFKKRAKKKHVRSDHKHEYETVCIYAHSGVVTREGRFLAYHLGARCKVCGRLRDVKMWRYGKALPESIPLYEVEDFFDLVSMKVLPEELKVRD